VPAEGNAGGAAAACTIGRSLLSTAMGEVLSFTYLIKPNPNRTAVFGFKKTKPNRVLKIETVTAL